MITEQHDREQSVWGGAGGGGGNWMQILAPALAAKNKVNHLLP